MFLHPSKYILALACLLIRFSGAAQELFAKSFVKDKVILLRWAPATKAVFDNGVKNGYKITRYTLTNAVPGEAMVVASSLKPFAAKDTAWIVLLKNNPNAALIVKALYQSSHKAGTDAKTKAEQDKMLFNMVLLSCDFNWEVARSSGLCFKDSGIDNSKKYLYRIEVNPSPGAPKAAACQVEVNAGVQSMNPALTTFYGVAKNKRIKFKWKASEHVNDYAGYNIERSADSIHYQKINRSPIILIASQYEKKKEFIYYNDTFPSVNTRYFYRLKGVNHFGELSEPSNIIAATGYNNVASIPYIDSICTIKNQQVYLHWSMKSPEENENVREFIVTRAKKDKGPYEAILKGKQTAFTDEHPESVNFYKISAVTMGMIRSIRIRIWH